MRVEPWFLLFVPVLASSQSQIISATQQSQSCCDALKITLHGKVNTAGSQAYNSSLKSYWSLQEVQVHPRCIVSPHNTKDVSTAVPTLVIGGKKWPGKCNFALRGGGHTPFAGSANIHDGITIDLSSLDGAVLSKDKSIVTIGPGARWANVYTSLIPHGLGTSGGRVAEVGVGGLTTGGGISFFSPRFGFVCDNVDNFEVVLHNGKIINANKDHHSDLWRALRGGSNNFGIVTAFDMRTFTQGDFWGGSIGSNISTRHEQFAFFENFTKSATYDPFSAFINSYAYVAQAGEWIIASDLEYTKSNPAEPNPPVFQPLTKLKQIFSTMRVTNITDLTVELGANSPSGLRDKFATATFANSAIMMEKFFQLANRTVHRLTEVSGLRFSVSYQPIPQIITSKAASEGGNSLGITEKDGDMFNVLTTIMWHDPKHDAIIEHETRRLFEEAAQAARQMGVFRKYLYLNYADKWQNPIAGYGEQEVKVLRAVSEKYDPQQVFQKQVPGGFKLSF